MLALFQWRALAHLLDRVLGRAEQLDDLRLRELREVAQQEGDRVRPVVALGHRRVAGAARLTWPRWPAGSAAAAPPGPPRSAGCPPCVTCTLATGS